MTQEELNDIFVSHNKWRTGDPSGRKACFVNADLRNLRFGGGQNLCLVDFSGANLSGCYMYGYFIKANFTGANLSRAKLGWSRFEEANFTNANLSYSNFNNCEISRANFTNANLRGVKLAHESPDLFSKGRFVPLTTLKKANKIIKKGKKKMANQAVLQKLRKEFPDLAVVYEAKLPLTTQALKNLMKNVVAGYKNEWKRQPGDRLAELLTKYGNKGGRYEARLRELMRNIYRDKSVPENFQGRWRSIEFELIFNNEQDENDFAKFVWKSGYGKLVTIKTDGSLRYTESRGGVCREVCVSYTEGNEDMIRNICAYLKDRAYVNKTCGTHVHFDMRHVPKSDVVLYGKRLARCVKVLKTILPPSRRENHYCLNEINDIDRASGTGDRYAFVNLHSWARHCTLEVRGHSGTIDAEKILHWIQICQKIMTTRIRTSTKEIPSVDALIKLFKFDSGTSNYIKSRYNRFNVPSATTGVVENFEDQDLV